MSTLVKRDTGKILQVAGSVGLITWLAVSIVPFFPILMGLLVLAGVGLHIRNR